jgi:hypothetical protein
LIIKNLSRKSQTGQLIKYICRYISNPEKQKGNSQFMIRHNLKEKTIEAIIKEYKINNERRIYKRKDQVEVFHTILSWSHKDAKYIDDKMLTAISKEYIRLRNDKALFLICKHENTKSTHLHICSSGNYINGLGARLSHAQFNQLKKDLTLFQIKHYPNLIHSLPQHSKPRQLREQAKPPLERFHAHKAGLTATLGLIVEKSKSFDAFLAHLSEKGLHPYYRGKDQTLSGITGPDNRKYRLSTLGIKEKVEELKATSERQKRELEEIKDIRERQEDREREIDEERDYDEDNLPESDREEHEIEKEIPDEESSSEEIEHEYE